MSENNSNLMFEFLSQLEEFMNENESFKNAIELIKQGKTTSDVASEIFGISDEIEDEVSQIDENAINNIANVLNEAVSEYELYVKNLPTTPDLSVLSIVEPSTADPEVEDLKDQGYSYKIKEDATQEWHKDDSFNDLPTIIKDDGTKEWHKDGVLHKDGDQPAVIRPDGTKEWYKNGKLHRDGDLPAIIDSNGTQEWYKNGELHRDNDLPAIIKADGTKEWYMNGKRHRDDNQPMVINSNGDLEWY